MFELCTVSDAPITLLSLCENHMHTHACTHTNSPHKAEIIGQDCKDRIYMCMYIPPLSPSLSRILATSLKQTTHVPTV